MENEGNHGAHGKKFSFVEITEWRRGGIEQYPYIYNNFFLVTLAI